MASWIEFLIVACYNLGRLFHIFKDLLVIFSMITMGALVVETTLALAPPHKLHELIHSPRTQLPGFFRLLAVCEVLIWLLSFTYFTLTVLFFFW